MSVRRPRRYLFGSCASASVAMHPSRQGSVYWLSGPMGNPRKFGNSEGQGRSDRWLARSKGVTGCTGERRPLKIVSGGDAVQDRAHLRHKIDGKERST
jgi:hypothetical protein